ncbi:MAG: ATP-binding protein [Thermodesulfobacteriota bacterium]|nr:ATP-binding protein [Thermodesulfobacteriota bacterium]
MSRKNSENNHYLLKAIETLERQIVVISEEYKILGARITRHPGLSLKTGDFEGKLCHAVFFNRKSPCLNCPVAEVIRTKQPSLNQLFSSGANDSSCLYAYPMEGSNGAGNAIVVLDFYLPFLDKFDDKRFTSNAFLRNLIHSAVDGVIAADMTGKIIIFNQAAAEISGYTKKEALESLNIRGIYPGNDAHKIMKRMRYSGYDRKGIIRSYKQLALRKDGTTTPILLNASIVYEENREIATIGFFHDLKETIRMEAELEKANLQLLQAEKMSSLGKLAAGVAHQLNNPLGGITLFSQLLLEEYELPEGAVNDILRIQSDAEKCSLIVKELLEFARQTKKEVKLHSLNEIVARTLFLLRNQALFQNIIIIENFDDNIPDIPVDVQQLNHVFMNIILNAADAMEGKGTLEIRSLLKKESNIVVIEISDTGPGIPEDILPNIFEPFFTTKEEGKGTGLGLSMAYGIIESHGGKLSAKNNNGKGVLFSIELPLKPDESLK